MMRRDKHDPMDLLAEAAVKMECEVSELEWWSWPQVFGSTSGPRGGIGGQALTTFQVYGFDNGKKRLLYCAGVWKTWRKQELRW